MSVFFLLGVVKVIVELTQEFDADNSGVGALVWISALKWPEGLGPEMDVVEMATVISL